MILQNVILLLFLSYLFIWVLGSLVDRGFQGMVGFIRMTREVMVLRGLVFT